MSDIEANRLTDIDRARMRSRVLERLDAWDTGARQHYGPGGPAYKVQSTDVDTLERLAHHAIGCSVDDLRERELVEIRGMVEDIVKARD